MRAFDKQGFILIEVCIAMLIISISVMLLSSSIQTFYHVEESKDNEVSNEKLLKELYEEK